MLPQAVAWLLSVPGASRTVLDMRIPYSRASLKDVLGKSPETYASSGGCWAPGGMGCVLAVAAAGREGGRALAPTLWHGNVVSTTRALFCFGTECCLMHTWSSSASPLPVCYNAAAASRPLHAAVPLPQRRRVTWREQRTSRQSSCLRSVQM